MFMKVSSTVPVWFESGVSPHVSVNVPEGEQSLSVISVQPEGQHESESAQAVIGVLSHMGVHGSVVLHASRVHGLESSQSGHDGGSMHWVLQHIWIPEQFESWVQEMSETHMLFMHSSPAWQSGWSQHSPVYAVPEQHTSPTERQSVVEFSQSSSPSI